MSDVSNFKSGQYFVANVDPHTKEVTLRLIPVPEPEISLTRSKFLRAWSDAIKSDSMPLSTMTPRLSLLMKQLGFCD